MEVDAVLWSLHCAWLWSGDNANRGAMRKVCPERQASARTLNLKLELSGGQSRGSPIVVSLSLSISLCAHAAIASAYNMLAGPEGGGGDPFAWAQNARA